MADSVVHTSRDLNGPLNINRHELEKIGTALKDKKFRDLLGEYANEISDPKNRELYEREITELEKERGIDVQFVIPVPGYVVKTFGNAQKVFLNICRNEKVRKPQCYPCTEGEKRGLKWSLPHLHSPLRPGVDKRGNNCSVVDVIFHDDTYHLATRSEKMKSVIETTAIEAAEKSCSFSLQRNNLKYPKIKYKGEIKSLIIRKPTNESCTNYSNFKEIGEGLNFPLPEISKTSNEVPQKLDNDYLVPEYSIKHRKHVDLQDYSCVPGSYLNINQPDQLIVEICLPLLDSTAKALLDVKSRGLSFTCNTSAKYKLNVDFDAEVDDTMGHARFDRECRRLIVTLPIRRMTNSVPLGQHSGKEKPTESVMDSDVLENVASSQLSSDCENVQSLQDNQLNDAVEDEPKEKLEDFLDSTVGYNVPNFVFKERDQFSGVLTFAVLGVDPESLNVRFCDNAVSLKFRSLGSGHVPQHYAVFLQVGSRIERMRTRTFFNEERLHLEITKTEESEWVSCIYGSSPSDAKERSLRTTGECDSNAGDKITKKGSESVGENTMKDEWITVPSRSSTSTKSGLIKWVQEYDKERHSSGDSSSSNSSRSSSTGGSNSEVISFFPHARKNRSVSESGGELPGRWPRGILKNRSMSLTESSEDMVLTSQSSMEFITTESCDDECSAGKKSVRFNDNVKRKFFRSTSSILEQKKKNVKREYRRKEAMIRASVRRSSESEASNSESEDRHQSEPLSDHVFGSESTKPWEELSSVPSSSDDSTRERPVQEEKARGEEDKAVSSDEESRDKTKKKNGDKKKRRNRRNKKQERKSYEGIQNKLLKGDECKPDTGTQQIGNISDPVERTNQLNNGLMYELEE